MSPHQELQYHEHAHSQHMAELPPKLSIGEEVPVLAPTPATDEAERLHHSESVPAQFCREMERSRDRWRAIAGMLADALSDADATAIKGDAYFTKSFLETKSAALRTFDVATKP